MELVHAFVIMSVIIDSVAFKRRLHLLQRTLKDSKSFGGVSCIVTALGKGDSETQGQWTSMLHIWLLGYPFANTAITISPQKCVIITSAKQAKHLDGIKSASVELRIRSKDPEESRILYKEMLDQFVPNESSFGVFADDTAVSLIAAAWKEEREAAVARGAKSVNVSKAFDELLANKDEDELRAIRTAAKASMGVMTQYFADEMTTIIDEEAKITHADFSEKVAAVIDNAKLFRKMKLGAEFDAALIDWSYQPIIQSGNNFDLSPDAKSDKTLLQAGIIYCSLGLRYKFYSSSIARTYLIDPSKEQEQSYSILLATEKRVLTAIREGAKCSDAFKAAKAYLSEKEPSLVSHLAPSVGYGVGVNHHDRLFELSEDNDRALQDGMTLVIQIAFTDLKDSGEDSKPYMLCVADTIRVTSDIPIVFTDAPKSRDVVSFYFKQEEEEPTKRERKPVQSSSNGRSMRSERQREQEESAEARILAHQAELKQRLQERGVEKYSDISQQQGADENKREFKKYESYKRETQLPPAVKDLRIMVDNRSQTIIVPISGRPVPFHINAYKNGSKNEEGEYVYLRLNFSTPDTIVKRDEAFENPYAQFLKSITLRSRDAERMNDTFKRIQEMKREATRREQERKELADVVQQDKLSEVRDRRPQRLEPVFVRPTPEGKRVAGSLEIHKNGVRYQSPLGKEQQVDVLFSNVDSLFFQPSDHELIVLIHIHLKNPIIVGKKKTKDIQFYRDATDMSYDDTGNKKRRYRYGDEDELEQEQEERRLRATLNKEFNNFAEQIAKASNGKLAVDIPFRELGFTGVPFRSNVLCQPTTDCLVQLVDTPFLVVRLDEVELVSLERIQFGLRQFDMVFIYKDYSKPVTHINSIPVSQLDSIKDWLNEMDIPFYEGPVNLTWPQVMKTVTSDPHEFFESGGWSFLANDDEDAAEEEVPEEESEFEVTDDEPEDESDSYAEEESEDLSENSFSGEDDSGEDWDDMEEEAAREDQRKEDRRGRR